MKSHYFWSAARQWGQRLGSALTFVILARLLPPDEIGLFSAALAIIAFAEILNESGAGEAVVRHREASAGAIKALNIANILASLLLAGSFALFADFIEAYFGTPGLSDVVRVLSLVLLANAFVYVPMAMMRRDMEFAALAQISLLGTVLGAAAGIGLAFAGAGVWALVAQALIFALSNLVIYRKRIRGRLATPADFRGARPLFAFGGYVLLGNLLAYACYRAVELALPYHYGAATLALYIVGSRFYFVASQMISAVALDVASVRLSSLATDTVAFGDYVLRTLRQSSIIGGTIFIGMAACAHPLLVLAFGEIGRGAYPYLIAVCFGGLPFLLAATLSVALKALGYAKLTTLTAAAQAVLVMIVLVPDWDLEPVDMIRLLAPLPLLPSFLRILPLANILHLNVRSIISAFADIWLALLGAFIVTYSIEIGDRTSFLSLAIMIFQKGALFLLSLYIFDASLNKLSGGGFGGGVGQFARDIGRIMLKSLHKRKSSR